MQIWAEEDVVHELASARARCEKGQKTMPFVLVLARKYHKRSYEWVFYAADCFDRMDALYEATPVVLPDGTLVEVSSGSSPDSASASSTESHGDTASTSSASSGEDPADNSWTARSHGSPFDSVFVGKAIFHTANAGKPLMKMEGSEGWREAMKQKYQIQEAQSRSLLTRGNDKNKTNAAKPKNLTAVKAVAAAATGSAAVAGGTSMAAAGMGYTATGIAANSMAAGIMASEAAATGGVAAGGFTATMQSIGAVGVMANPVGMGLAAVGAVGGLAMYGIHRQNQKKKQREQKLEEEIDRARQLHAQCMVEATENTPMTDASGRSISYERLAHEEEEEEIREEISQKNGNCWTVVFAKKVGTDEYCFIPSVSVDQLEAETEFMEVSSDTSAKALVNCTGSVVKLEVDAEHEEEWDGWESALALHYDFLMEKGTLQAAAVAAGMYGGSATLQTPLLREEEGAA